MIYKEQFINMPTIMQRIFSKVFSKPNEKIEITIEQSESWELHSLHKTETKICKKCSVETIFVPLDLGFEIIKADENSKANLLSNSNLHLSESIDSANLVCLQSLQSEYRQEKTLKIVGNYINDEVIQ